MQIKYGFKKEWLQFSRTFRFGGILIAIFSFALADPLMYMLLNFMMNYINNMEYPQMAAVMTMSNGTNTLDMVSGMINDSGLIFSMTMADLCATSLLIIMLILMSPAGGEQKKRATIIPSCCGLKYFNYLVPKFVIYPLTVFGGTFLAVITAGGLCNMLFSENHIDFGMILLAAFLCAVYAAFITTVYLSIGLCTSKPGVVTVLVYLGASLVEIILTSLDLTKFHPFTLRSLVTSEMFVGEFELSENIASICVGTLLSIIVMALMFFMAYAVLNAKKINNQEDKPEF